MSTDHMETHSAIRDALHSAKNGIVSVPQFDLLELLAEFDALKSAGTAPKKGEYTPEFEAAWDAYPKRPGASKAATFKAWKARLKAGASAEKMIEGAVAYAAYCKRERTEPQYIKQATTFFGPGEFYAADWAPRLPAAAGHDLVAAAMQNRRGAPPDDFQGVTIDV